MFNKSVGRDLLGHPGPEDLTDAQEMAKAPGVHGVDLKVGGDLGRSVRDGEYMIVVVVGAV